MFFQKSKKRHRYKEKIVTAFLLTLILGGCNESDLPSEDNSENQNVINQTSKQDLAICLKQKGVLMYGSNNCEYCRLQKKIFGLAFEQIKFINCDFESDRCQKAGVIAYPTWEINRVNYQGVKSLKELSALSGCQQN